MCVVIVGGNERMERQYRDACEARGCKTKIFLKDKGEMRRNMGSPDLVILFTSTVSHGMVNCALSEAKRCDAAIARSHSSSLNALHTILRTHCVS
jgi:hypothetical protein